MKVVIAVVFAAVVLAILTGSCDVEFYVTNPGASDPPREQMATTKLPSAKPPSPAIHRAAAPAAWTADICGAVKDWKADWARRVQEIDQAILRSRGLDERRTLYVDFWDETVRSTTELVGDFDAAGHPAVRGGEAVARGYRGVFAETVPAMEMALAVATALPEDPERFSEGEAEIRTNMARAFAIRNHDLDALHDRLEASLPANLRDAFDNDPTCRAI